MEVFEEVENFDDRCTRIIEDGVAAVEAFDLPKPDADYTQTVLQPFYDASGVQANGQPIQCFSNFQLRLMRRFGAMESDALPTYYSVVSETGQVQFTNRADQLIDDELVLSFLHSNGQRIDAPAFRVKTQCGPDSTDLSAPAL